MSMRQHFQLPSAHLSITCSALAILFFSCQSLRQQPGRLRPDFTTDKTAVDTDDPAIWINYQNPLASLILGTDKGDANGGIYVFNLQGKLLREKSITGLPRPNNIDIAYHFPFAGDTIDIAVFTQRNADNIRVLRLPDMVFIDGGGIPVFEGEAIRAPMGVGLYREPANGELTAIISRKSGPDGSYLWQYRLVEKNGQVSAERLRSFGAFKGGKEIEAIAVDQEAGHIYYADEGAGIRKYYASATASTDELALFGQEGFKEDHEGISIYPTGKQSGYILVSDQQANQFQVFSREAPHQRLAVIPVSTRDSDGSELSAFAFGDLYPKGFFVAMSTNRTFQIYRWEKLEAAIQAQLIGNELLHR